ncbi:hypothetical protein DSL72_004146 [Monilinia vaccinii-corymbosi]|uniref:Enoyl reductase (ER) domain-containing protein n=1 Tax=Monilinia vaccinii-corymbosi TaxID=61207 RepID=A0A8A3NZR1_9HELO|nr:hypothetical protein DSL72_004146 [Monilinia vaccinii-corymbosi]
MASPPPTYKALRFHTLSGPLTVEEQDISSIQTPKTLLIKVRFASINPVDTQLWRAGIVSVVSGSKGMGRDFSGTIVAVGGQVKGDWSVGEEVFGLLFQIFGQGTFSQYIAVDPASDPVVKKPNCLSHEAAASIPLVALTMFAALDWLPARKKDVQRKVIVRGASGGCGSWAVQCKCLLCNALPITHIIMSKPWKVAKLLYDCHVTAICSSRNVDYVQSLGADEVIDYTSQPVLQTLLESKSASAEFDLLIDCVGGTELIPSYPELLHPKGAYVTIVGDKTDVKGLGGPVTYFKNPVQIWRYLAAWIWGPRYAVVSLHTRSEYLEKVVGLAERAQVKIEIQEVIKDALNEEKGEWKRAIEMIETARVRGKLVLEIL